MRDALVGEDPQQALRVAENGLRGHEARAAGVGRHQVREAGVERGRQDREDARVGTQPEGLALGVQERGHAPVGDADALGPARRPGAVDEPGGVREGGQPLLHDVGPGVLDAPDDERGGDRLDEPPSAFGRPVGVDRRRDRAREPHPPHRRRPVFVGLDLQQDPGPHPQSFGAESVRQGRRATEQRLVVEDPPVAALEQLLLPPCSGRRDETMHGGHSP